MLIVIISPVIMWLNFLGGRLVISNSVVSITSLHQGGCCPGSGHQRRVIPDY